MQRTLNLSTADSTPNLSTYWLTKLGDDHRNRILAPSILSSNLEYVRVDVQAGHHHGARYGLGR